LNGECWDAAWDWHTELTQDFLALVLVNLHEGSLRGVETRPVRRGACFRRARQQALDTAALECIMLQCTNPEPCVLHWHDAEDQIS
jgi:hypothetical protein